MKFSMIFRLKQTQHGMQIIKEMSRMRHLSARKSHGSLTFPQKLSPSYCQVEPIEVKNSNKYHLESKFWGRVIKNHTRSGT